VNVSGQYNHGIKALLDMIAFLLSLMIQPKECNPLILPMRLLFSFTYAGTYYPCALVHWFAHVGDNPDEDTGLWMVKPDHDAVDDSPHVAVIHLDTVLRCAHLIGVYGSDILLKDMSYTDSLDAFRSFYVNKFIDHHAFQIAY
jgi:hypothetical protein